ncbi:MAG: DUF1576 domain-containing protein [Bacillota bacterium]|nr:DUF1576 domain-containing protein [Bacillota bacterium]
MGIENMTDAHAALSESAEKESPEKAKIGYVLPFSYGLLLIVAAFFYNSPVEILTGFIKIITSPSQLMTDYMVLTSVGAALFNTGLMMCLGVLLLVVSHTPLNGGVFAALFTVMGFSSFGKNPFNALPIFCGVYFFTRLLGIPFREKATVALYGTGLGPLVSAVAFVLELPPFLALPLAFAVGLLIGFVQSPLLTSFSRFHRGYSLYNAGFTNGIAGMIFISFMSYIGCKIDKISLVYRGPSIGLAVLLGLVFASLMLIGFFFEGRSLRRYSQLLQSSGRAGSDFMTQYGHGISLFNMGVCGFVGMAYALLMGGQLNGPIIAGIMMMAGFGANGKHLRNITPVLLGLALINVLTGHDPTWTSAVIAGLFGTSLAPIAGEYGTLAGMVAGALHMTLVGVVGNLHAGVVLYNNGFSCGFIAAFLVPWLELLEDHGWLLGRNVSRRLAGRGGRQPLALKGDGNPGERPSGAA